MTARRGQQEPSWVTAIRAALPGCQVTWTPGAPGWDDPPPVRQPSRPDPKPRPAPAKPQVTAPPPPAADVQSSLF